MLVIRMLDGESVVLLDSSGNPLGEVVLLPRGEDTTKLGFNFPKSIQIVRKKLYDKGWSGKTGVGNQKQHG